MYPSLRELIYKAETQYLEEQDLETSHIELSTLKQRVNVYKTLRDREVEIFQAIAEQLLAKLPAENVQDIEYCLRQWISITRYCAMAMILNNPEFLERSLLEWLTDITQANQHSVIFDTLHSLLVEKLNQIVFDEDSTYIIPFLDQAHNYLNTNVALTK